MVNAARLEHIQVTDDSTKEPSEEPIPAPPKLLDVMAGELAPPEPKIERPPLRRPVAKSAADTIVSEPAPKPTSKRRGSRVAGVLAVLVVLAAAAIAAYYFRGEPIQAWIEAKTGVHVPLLRPPAGPVQAAPRFTASGAALQPRISVPPPPAGSYDDFGAPPPAPPPAEESTNGLAITKLALCMRVNGFGRYEPFGEGDFKAGSLPLILVYAELTGFVTKQEADTRFVVKLTEEMTLADPATNADIWHGDPISLTDVSQSRKVDLFQAQYLPLPNNMPAGRYSLRVKITDQNSGMTTISSLPLTIVSP